MRDITLSWALPGEIWKLEVTPVMRIFCHRCIDKKLLTSVGYTSYMQGYREGCVSKKTNPLIGIGCFLPIDMMQAIHYALAMEAKTRRGDSELWVCWAYGEVVEGRHSEDYHVSKEVDYLEPRLKLMDLRDMEIASLDSMWDNIWSWNGGM